jgi:hypothetical protein
LADDTQDKTALLAAHDEALRKSRERLLKVQIKQMRESVERIQTVCNGLEGTLAGILEEWKE